MIPTSGATAAYVRRSPKSECSSSAYARSKESSSQSKPPHASATRRRRSTRTVRKSASSSVGGGAGMGARVDPRRRLADELLERDRGVLAPSQAIGARLDEVANEGPVLVRAPGRPCPRAPRMRTAAPPRRPRAPAGGTRTRRGRMREARDGAAAPERPCLPVRAGGRESCLRRRARPARAPGTPGTSTRSGFGRRARES